MTMKKIVLTPRQQKSQQTKNSIYLAALQLIKTYEYQYLTVRNICKAAGVSTGTFYHHFESKDALLAYYLFAIFNADDVISQLDFDGDIRKEIVYIYDVYLDYCMEAGIEFLSNYYSSKNKALDIRDHYSEEDLSLNQVAKAILERLADARKRHLVKDDVDDHTIMNDLCVLAKGVIFEWCVNGGKYDIKEYFAKMTNIYLDSVLN